MSYSETGSLQRGTMKQPEAEVTNVSTIWKSEKKNSSSHKWLRTHARAEEPVISQIFSNFTAADCEQGGLN